MDDTRRGQVAWHMRVIDCVIGHLIGFSYEMNGDNRPDVQVKKDFLERRGVWHDSRW